MTTNAGVVGKPPTQATELYQRTVLEHNKSPRCYGEVAAPTNKAQGHNPICGDVVHIAARLEQNQVVELRFTAQSCALCKASASIMCDSLQNKSMAEIRGDVEQFLRMLKGETPQISQSLSVFSVVRDFPARAKCVMLPWKTLLGALAQPAHLGDERDAVISTEQEQEYDKNKDKDKEAE